MPGSKTSPRTAIRTIVPALVAVCILAGAGTSVHGAPESTPIAATPTFLPTPRTYTSVQQVKLADATAHAVIHYTLDGTAPTNKSAAYANPIKIGKTTTIKAIALATGYRQSSIASGTFIIKLPAAAPTFTPLPKSYNAPVQVTLKDSTPGAKIYYTLNGAAPSTGSSTYSHPIALSATTTIKAKAVAAGYSVSPIVTATYTIKLEPAAKPTFSPAPATYSPGQKVTIADTTKGAVIHYTLDNSAPSVKSPVFTNPITLNATTTIKAIATAPGSTPSVQASATYIIGGPVVSVVLSSYNLSKAFSTQPDMQFSSAVAASNPVYIDDTERYQTIEGFGASFTDTAGYDLNEVATPATRTLVMSNLFTRNGMGIGLSFVRNPMGASDLARTVYSYDDKPQGQTDPGLTDFSIAHDQKDIIPLLLEARSLNPDLKVMANPWSPPAWMKSSDSMFGNVDGGGTLEPASYSAFANYFVKYVQAYQKAGIPIDYISLQNEPSVAGDYPGMNLDAPTAIELIDGYMLPALKANNLSTKILLFDWNYDGAAYPESELADPTILASDQVAGVAWHGYSGTAGAIQTLLNKYPTKGAWETEHSGGTWNENQFRTDFEDITQVMRNGARSFVKWSLAVDQNYGPDLTSEGNGGGCNTCYGVVTIDSTNGSASYPSDYYTLGHFSKFVLSGAQHIYSSNAYGVITSAYLNPDGMRTLVAFNDSTTAQTFQVQWGTQSFTYTLPVWDAVTFTWSGTQIGTPAVDAKTQIMASSFNSVSSLQTEVSNDVSGGYDLGYASDGSYAVYRNVDFGASVSGLTGRVATQNSAASMEFHLDSPAGTLVGTLAVPNTGAWQSWTTATTTASGASGLHDLYVVYKGAAANLNWFQFN